MGQASPCHRALLFELQLRRGSGGAWRPLRTGLSKSALSLDELRCPEGCSFRYGPSNLPGGPPELSAPSLPVPTLALPRLARGALRLQLRLLQTVADVASDKNSTLVMPFPIEMLRFFDNASGTTAEDADADRALTPPEVNGSGPAPAITTGPEADRR